MYGWAKDLTYFIIYHNNHHIRLLLLRHRNFGVNENDVVLRAGWGIHLSPNNEQEYEKEEGLECCAG